MSSDCWTLELHTLRLLHRSRLTKYFTVAEVRSSVLYLGTIFLNCKSGNIDRFRLWHSEKRTKHMEHKHKHKQILGLWNTQV